MTGQTTGILAAILGLAALVGPAAAQTRCATRADLTGGIVVTYDGGAMDTFTADPAIPGAVIWQGEYQGMNLGTTVLAQGFIYLSSVSPASGGEEVRYDYGILPADLPIPLPGEGWEGVAVVTAGGVSSTERQIHSYGQPVSLALGECSWTQIPVTIRYPGNTEELLWFPELGLSVRAGDVIRAITPLALMP